MNPFSLTVNHAEPCNLCVDKGGICGTRFINKAVYEGKGQTGWILGFQVFENFDAFLEETQLAQCLPLSEHSFVVVLVLEKCLRQDR